MVECYLWASFLGAKGSAGEWRLFKRLYEMENVSL